MRRIREVLGLLVTVMLIGAAPSAGAGPAATASGGVDGGTATADQTSPGVVEAEADVHGVRVKVRASSVLNDPKQPSHYSPANLLDTDDSTVWAEGVPGSAQGQWIELQFPAGQELEGLELTPGHGRSAGLYLANSRLKTATVEYVYNNGARQTVSLAIPRDLPFGSWLLLYAARSAISRVRLTVDSVWPGSRDDDFCLARLRPIFRSSLKKLVGEEEAKEEELGLALVSFLENPPFTDRFLARGVPVIINEYDREIPVDGPLPAPEASFDATGEPNWDWDAYETRISNSLAGALEKNGSVLRIQPDPAGETYREDPLPVNGKAPRGVHTVRLHWGRVAGLWKLRGLDLKKLSEKEQNEP